jgi:tetratricopeptide (TPR) repeat protein
MTQADVATPPSRSAWIISPLWDLLYIVATPVVIVPAVLVLQQRVLPEAISLFVMAFATLGHHLPGYMRAYGDRELFERFKWRFVLIPPLALAVALVFSVPALVTTPVSQWWGDSSTLLGQPSWHGLELVLFFWATWHGLMQTYGFMRIYDLKRGGNSIGAARFDFALCLAIFAAGVVLSDARAASLMETLWNCGAPTFSADAFATVRHVIATGTLALIVVYLFYQFATASSPSAVNWTKLLLAATTGVLYWFAGLVTTNLIVGVALFEIFHAIQYYAIVWVYNRNRVQRVGGNFGPLGFLFRDHWAALGLYLAAIAAFGGLRWYSDGIQSDLSQRVLLAVFTASTLLHYYYDGFIWKVSERRTQVDLDTAAPARFEQIRVPALVHAAKWAVFLIGVAWLAGLERQVADVPRARANVESYLATWFPKLPEVETRVARRKLEENDIDGAIALARHVVEMRPRSHAAHADLGKALLDGALLDDRRYAQAQQSFEEALDLMPDRWEYHDFLAAALEGQGNYLAAVDHYRLALALAPKQSQIRVSLVLALVQIGKGQEALAEAENVAAVAGQSWRAQMALGIARFAVRDFAAALPPLREAVRIAPRQAEPYYRLGCAQFYTGDARAAEASLNQAIRLDPKHGMAHFQLGMVHLHAHRYEPAVRAYEMCTRLLPEFADAYTDLGAAYHDLDRLHEAAAAYRTAIERSPRNAKAHYNLGLVLLAQGDTAAARRYVEHARELGLAPSPDVRAALGL